MTEPADIVGHAERVLASAPAYVWDGERVPVPVEDIADTVFGLLVRDVHDMGAAPGAPTLREGQALSGLLLAARGEIWVNADEARQWPPRRRFTIGHELGHWVMHRAPGQQSLFCRRTTVDERGERAHAVRDIEDEASVFAAELLMPRWLVVREHARAGGDLAELCRVFDASRAAMERRVAISSEPDVRFWRTPATAASNSRGTRRMHISAHFDVDWSSSSKNIRSPCWSSLRRSPCPYVRCRIVRRAIHRISRIGSRARPTTSLGSTTAQDAAPPGASGSPASPQNGMLWRPAAVSRGSELSPC